MPHITHEDTLSSYDVPFDPRLLPPYDFKDYVATLGVITETVVAHKMLRIVGSGSCGKSFSLLHYAKLNHHAVYIELGTHQTPQALLTKLALAAGLHFKPKTTIDEMQQLPIQHLLNMPELVYLIDEADFLCPAGRESLLPTLKCIRYIWQYTYIPFIMASTYELETRLQNNKRGVSTSQFYRRTGYKQMNGVSKAEAQEYLTMIESEFPVKFDQDARNSYAERMTDTEHAGLSKVIEALEQCFQKIFKPTWHDYTELMLAGMERKEALQIFEGIDTVRIDSKMANSSLKHQK